MTPAQRLAAWEVEQLERQARLVDLRGLTLVEMVRELEKLTKVQR